MVSQDRHLLGTKGNDLIYPVEGASPAFSSVGLMLTLYGLIRKFLICTLSHPYRGADILVFSTQEQQELRNRIGYEVYGERISKCIT